MGNSVVEQGFLVVGVTSSSLVVGGLVAAVSLLNPVGAILTIVGGVAIAWGWSNKSKAQ